MKKDKPSRQYILENMRSGKPGKNKTTELQKTLVQFCLIHGAMLDKINTTGIPDKSLPGGMRKNFNNAWPDIVGCYRGMFFAFEVKRGNDSLSEKQQDKIAKFRKAGGNVIIAKTANQATNEWKEFKQQVDKVCVLIGVKLNQNKKREK